MDVMNLKDLALVGLPETVISLIFGLLLFQEKLTREKKVDTIISYLTSIIIILSFITISRSTFDSYIKIAVFSTIAYILSFKLQFKLNWRQAIVSGGLVMYQLIALETVVLPIFTSILNSILNSFPFFSMRLVFSIPIRLFQILILLIMVNNDINLRKNSLLNSDWSKLTLAKKITSTILIMLILISVIFCMNYVEMFIKIKTNGIDPSIFGSTLNLVQIATIFFELIVLILLSRTTKYEMFKDILYSEPKEIFFPILENIINALDDDKREEFREKIDEYFQKSEKGGVINEKN